MLATATPPRPAPGSAAGVSADALSPAPIVSTTALAGRLNVPVQLPVGYKGEPIPHLSHSSLMRWMGCPDDWRRHYIKGERGPRSGAMFLGNRVDDTVSIFYRRQIAGEVLSLEQLEDALRDNWRENLASEDGAIDWEPYLAGDRALNMGLAAVRITHEQLIPRLGQATAVQRKFELRLAPGLKWTILGYVDLDTVRRQHVYVDQTGASYAVRDEGEAIPTITMAYEDAPKELRPQVKIGRTTYDPSDAIDEHRRAVAAYDERVERIEREGPRPGEKNPRTPKALPDIEVPVDAVARFGDIIKVTVAGITDFKVKNAPASASQAHHDPQASLYLAERWLTEIDCRDFRFAQVAKPGARRQAIATSLVRTTRTVGAMRAVFMRYAMAAAQIVATYNTFGPDQAWGFAPDGHWKCQPDAESALTPGGRATRGRFCTHWAACPCGAGLGEDT